MTPLRLKPILALLVLFALALGISFALSGVSAPSPFAGGSGSLAEAIRTGTAERPEFSTTTMQKIEASKGFQHLVSYTDRGFEPSELYVERGETVRFTNNSSGGMWVAATGDPLYPGVQNGCGSSELDSCGTLEPMDFWEFTLEAAGDWVVTDNLDKQMTILVRVR